MVYKKKKQKQWRPNGRNSGKGKNLEVIKEKSGKKNKQEEMKSSDKKGHNSKNKVVSYLP